MFAFMLLLISEFILWYELLSAHSYSYNVHTKLLIPISLKSMNVHQGIMCNFCYSKDHVYTIPLILGRKCSGNPS